MAAVGKAGRTIIFVSHNMAAVTSLCKSAILLDGGKITASGTPTQIIKEYYTSGSMGRVDYTHAQEKPGRGQRKVNQRASAKQPRSSYGRNRD
jgi:lipopolysaccharide transport system ATP-binding protein